MGCGESKHAVATADSTITMKRNKDVIKPVVDDQPSQNENNVEVKDIAEAKEIEGNIIKEEEPGRLISKESPNRFFSSRKDEDAEGIASDKSEYFSPCVGSGKDISFNDCVKSDDVAAPDETSVQQTKLETEKGESAVENEKDVADEAKTEASIEPEVPSPDAEKKQNTEEEKLAVSPS